MRRTIIVLCYSFGLSIPLVAQGWTAGFGLGIQRRMLEGTNLIADSMLVQARMGGSDRTSFSSFLKFQATHEVQAMAVVSVLERLDAWTVTDTRTQCGLCPISKSTVISSFAADVEVSLGYRICRVNVSGILEIYGLVGGRGSSHFTKESSDVSFGTESAGRGLKVGFLEEAELLNNLDRTIKPFEFGGFLGISTEWRQISLYARYDWSIGSVTRNVEYYRRSYNLQNSAEMFTITIGYSIISF